MTTVATLMNLLCRLKINSGVYCIADDKQLILFEVPNETVTPPVNVLPMGYEWQE